MVVDLKFIINIEKGFFVIAFGNKARIFPKNHMHHMGFMHHIKKMHEKFEISKEAQGDKLVITFKGKKEDVDKLNKKMDAMHVLMEDCCTEDGGCC